jgi:hypothetical protein
MLSKRFRRFAKGSLLSFHHGREHSSNNRLKGFNPIYYLQIRIRAAKFSGAISISSVGLS